MAPKAMTVETPDPPLEPRPLSAEDVEALFTRADGSFHFARWGRPLAPVILGVEDETVALFKGAAEALCMLTDHRMTEMDPELGANLMVFFIRDWSELTDTPNLDRLIPDLVPLVARLERADANQYRFLRFDEAGAIRACFAFLRMDRHLDALGADALALSQMAQSMLLWSDMAGPGRAPLAMVNGRAMLRPEVADLLRAAYDPVIPAMSRDPSTALRLAARLGRSERLQ